MDTKLAWNTKMSLIKSLLLILHKMQYIINLICSLITFSNEANGITRQLQYGVLTPKMFKMTQSIRLSISQTQA